MQRSVRNHKQIRPMVEFVLNGGVFDRNSLNDYADKFGLKSSPLIQIERFEDGRCYPRDGHHRIAGIWLGKRDYLVSSEYEIKYRMYSEYMDINLKVGWVTPFDPRLEIRIEDLADWKLKISSLREKMTENEIVDFIRSNKSSYTEPRGDIKHIRDVNIPD